MYQPLVSKNLSVKQISDIADRAKQNNLGYYEVKKMNPWIMKNSLPEGKRDIKIINNE